jgi:hypothetical protein
MINIFVQAIESAAEYIGLTIDNSIEALLYVALSGRAQQYACDLSEYAMQVFNVVCEAPV